MALKHAMTSLGTSGVLDAAEVAALAAAGITTVEELVGALRADPGAVMALLGRPASDADELVARAAEVLPARTRRMLLAPLGARPALGALPPRRAAGTERDDR